MAYDSARQRVVLFGGYNGSTSFSDTWEWDGATWTQPQPAASPSARFSHAMAYDSTSQRVVMLGGQGYSISDTWLYGSLIPASAVSLGTACAGTNGLPLLTSNTPYLGNSNFLLDLLSARASAPCAFGLAAVTQSISLGGGCTLYLQNPIVTLVRQTNASGFASISLNVPLDPSLRGGTLYAQAFVLDSNGGPLGLAVTAGRQLVVGD